MISDVLAGRRFASCHRAAFVRRLPLRPSSVRYWFHGPQQFAREGKTPMFAPSLNLDLSKLAQPDEKSTAPAKKVAKKGARTSAQKAAVSKTKK